MAKTTRKSNKSSNAAAAVETNQFDMTASVTVEHAHPEGVIPGVDLEAIFADLEGDEIVEQGDDSAAHPSELEMQAAVSEAEHVEALAEVYAEQGAVDGLLTAPAADVPSVDSTAKPKKEKKAKAPKEPKEPRMTYLNKKSEIVAARTVGFELVLEAADAALDEEGRKAKQAEFLATIDAMPKKVGEKAVQFFSDVQKYHGVGDIKNEVMRRAIALLIKEGELTSGDKGNLQADLLAKPYSIGTARSQSTQMFALLPALKITLREKGRMIPNPDSVLLSMLKGS